MVTFRIVSNGISDPSLLLDGRGKSGLNAEGPLAFTETMDEGPPDEVAATDRIVQAEGFGEVLDSFRSFAAQCLYRLYRCDRHVVATPPLLLREDSQ